MSTFSLEMGRAVLARALPDLFRRPNVVACGLGYKVRGDERTDELSLVVSVTRKVPPVQLSAREMIPTAMEGMPTDVVEVGVVRALEPVLPDLRQRYRPVFPGLSIGHPLVTAGTFGFLVRRGDVFFVLSNNHVLAARNRAKVGDLIWQPGPLDGGTAADGVATLAAFEPLDFGEAEATCDVAGVVAQVVNGLASLIGSEHRLRPVRVTPGVNVMDAALARIDPQLAEAAVAGVGVPTGVAEPRLGMRVQKVGRTTGWTEGTVTQVAVTVDVAYHEQKARFGDQVFATWMSAPGDSGAGVLDEGRRGVGLLFAGSDRVSILTPLPRVLAHFDVALVAEG